MADPREFLSNYKELAVAKADMVSSRTDQIVLEVILLGHDDATVVFGHFNRVFAAALADIIDISDAQRGIANPFAAGHPATLTLKPTAIVQQRTDTPASELLADLPFVMARPSLTQATSRPPVSSGSERWFTERGMAFEAADSSTTIWTPGNCPEYTTVYTATQNGLDRQVDRNDVDRFIQDKYDNDGVKQDTP